MAGATAFAGRWRQPFYLLHRREYKWHYQATPMDGFDFDNTAPLTMADIIVDGQPKHVVMQAPKNGVCSM
ncbi:MAG: hypothetical protein WDM77_14710 [Steroidobacteraceae bacterium]